MLVLQLSENTLYCLKIRPECKASGIGLDSDISDLIQTKIVVPDMLKKPGAENDLVFNQSVCISYQRMVLANSFQERISFKEAVKQAWNAREKWYYIGLCLGVNKN